MYDVSIYSYIMHCLMYIDRRTHYKCRGILCIYLYVQNGSYDTSMWFMFWHTAHNIKDIPIRYSIILL